MTFTPVEFSVVRLRLVAVEAITLFYTYFSLRDISSFSHCVKTPFRNNHKRVSLILGLRQQSAYSVCVSYKYTMNSFIFGVIMIYYIIVSVALFLECCSQYHSIIWFPFFFLVKWTKEDRQLFWCHNCFTLRELVSFKYSELLRTLSLCVASQCAGYCCSGY